MMRSLPLVLAASAAITAVVACGGPSADPAPSPSSSSNARVVVAASSATRSELGVAQWEVTQGNDRTTIVVGYDVAGSPRIRFEQDRSSTSEFRASLSGPGFRARIVVDASNTSRVRVETNDFAESAASRTAIERLRDDLSAQGSGGTTSLTTRASGITPKDTAGGGTLVDVDGGTTVAGSTGCLAKRCQTALVGTASSGAATIGACALTEAGSTLMAGSACSDKARERCEQNKEPDDCSSGGSDAVCRAMEWVNAKMPYCGGPKDGPDQICGGTCSREGTAVRDDWNKYRSDCSGLVSWAWGLPTPGRVTWELAPFKTDVSELTSVDALAPGDALNNEKHIMLFAGWVDKAAVKATIIEEFDCGEVARSKEYTLTKVDDSTVKTSDGRQFRTIRHKP